MKKAPVLVVVMCVVMLGCTSASQPYAAKSLDLSSQQFRTIVDDLATRGKWHALRNTVREVQATSDPAEEKKLIVAMSDDYEEISWLEIQAERAQALLRNGREFVWAQKGILNILLDDLRKSKIKSDAKNSVTTSSIPSSVIDKVD